MDEHKRRQGITPGHHIMQIPAFDAEDTRLQWHPNFFERQCCLTVADRESHTALRDQQPKDDDRAYEYDAFESHYRMWKGVDMPLGIGLRPSCWSGTLLWLPWWLGCLLFCLRRLFTLLGFCNIFSFFTSFLWWWWAVAIPFALFSLLAIPLKAA